jgi:hypothetical protein
MQPRNLRHRPLESGLSFPSQCRDTLTFIVLEDSDRCIVSQLNAHAIQKMETYPQLHHPPVGRLPLALSD